MVSLDEAPGVAENGGFVFDGTVGREAAGTAADAHAAAARVEAQADADGGFDRVVETSAVGIKAEMIRGGRAAGKDELGHGGEREDTDHLGRETGPDGLEGF